MWKPQSLYILCQSQVCTKPTMQYLHIIKLTSYAASCIIKLVTIILLLLLLLGSASSTVSTYMSIIKLVQALLFVWVSW